MQGHGCTFIYMHIYLLRNPIIFSINAWQIILFTQHLYKYSLKLSYCNCVSGVAGEGLLFYVALEVRNIPNLTANQKLHYLSPHLAGAADNARLCSSFTDRRQCFL